MSIFEITGKDIAELKDDELRDLIGLLCEEECRSLSLAYIPKKEYVVATNGVNFLPFLQSFEFPDMFAWLNFLGSIAIPRTDRCLHPRVRATSSGYPIPLIY